MVSPSLQGRLERVHEDVTTAVAALERVRRLDVPEIAERAARTALVAWPPGSEIDEIAAMLRAEIERAREAIADRRATAGCN